MRVKTEQLCCLCAVCCTWCRQGCLGAQGGRASVHGRDAAKADGEAIKSEGGAYRWDFVCGGWGVGVKLGGWGAGAAGEAGVCPGVACSRCGRGTESWSGTFWDREGCAPGAQAVGDAHQRQAAPAAAAAAAFTAAAAAARLAAAA